MVSSRHPYIPLRQLLFAAVVAFLAITPTLHAQRLRHAIFTRSNAELRVERLHLLSVKRAVPLNLDLEMFRQAASSNMYLQGIPVTADRTVDLDLTEFFVIAPGAKIGYTDSTGFHELDRITTRLFRGKISDDPKSEAFLAVSDHGVIARISNDKESYEITTNVGLKHGPEMIPAVAYPSSDLPVPMLNCATKELPLTKLEMEAWHRSESQLMADEPCPKSLYAVQGAWEKPTSSSFWSSHSKVVLSVPPTT